ncbi:MAG: glycoside hydrolase family 2 protein, partial [Alistipes sp.]|nr:glycoside hydrolase family 2 protein [Alistipes sp.]
QWSDRNFNANYGGIPKNVWLHLTDPLYQTLPLYSNLRTTGVYIYADDIRTKSRTADIHAESEIKNESKRDREVTYRVEVVDRDGTTISRFEGAPTLVKAGETKTLAASATVEGLHFWSWGYGYLYTVKTSLWVEGKKIDEVATRTGFRKTRFGEGLVWLNDRVIQLKGYAQRTSNEWPAVGASIPAWLSDYSNGLMVESNANLVRWMHITPWKQDIESCDRVGLLQAMPAGDAEKDRTGRQWEQRLELMRDAIIYNRNNPSIIFYECGNESISREHMVEMKALRDRYDPHGGRAIGSREMLDIREAEYGGEMLYINKSKHHPMWAMEYCRDEALRKYWDEYSYPYHVGNETHKVSHTGMMYRGQQRKDMSAYNRNQDDFAIEVITRWYDYWRERPGTGSRVSSGGVKIVFSDTNTHFRGDENYRRSGSTDPMRIPKDAFFAHQVMWDGWVDIEQPRIHIIGHWNYKPDVIKPIYVVSSAERVELKLNGKSLGEGERSFQFLFTFPDVAFEAGRLEAVGYDAEGRECCRTALETAGTPAAIRLKAIQSPAGWKADGADMVLV